jgi:hypothetical protein
LIRLPGKVGNAVGLLLAARALLLLLLRCAAVLC